jgi:hypothetical protein
MPKALLVAAVIIALPTVAANAREPRQRDTGGQGQIACTISGCVTIPRGCVRVPGRTPDGSPSGFDVIVCPPGIQPYR